jgi:hypothetical protein
MNIGLPTSESLKNALHEAFLHARTQSDGTNSYERLGTPVCRRFKACNYVRTQTCTGGSLS